jgi:trk system potassium uptake protein TrkH
MQIFKRQKPYQPKCFYVNLFVPERFSGSAAIMGNVGPEFGRVGYLDNFSQIPTLGEWVLRVNMMLGRLVLFFMTKSWR